MYESLTFSKFATTAEDVEQWCEDRGVKIYASLHETESHGFILALHTGNVAWIIRHGDTIVFEDDNFKVYQS